MGYYIAVPAAPNQTMVARIQQITEDGRPGVVWDETNGQWSTLTTFPIFANDEQIALAEQESTGVLEHAYVGETTNNLGTYTGWIMVHVYNVTLDNYDWHVAYVAQGVSSRAATEWTGADVVEGLANGVEQSVRVRVRKYANPNTPATGSVVTSRAGAPGGGLGPTTNTATYSGTPGIYKVTLTATETDVEAALRDDLEVEIVTSDGTGKAYLSFAQSELEDNWDTGGVLRTQLQTIENYTDQIRADVAYEQSTLWPTVPTLLGIENTVWNATAASHVGAGTFGELVERLDILASGGAGELTPTRANKLDFLDQNVSGNASSSDVFTQATAALVTLHLDHLFAATYDPTNKPGVASALFNNLVEADGADSRFTVNALENAPSGGGGADSSAIATAVWANATGVTVTNNVAAILADTDAIDTSLNPAGVIYSLIDGNATQASLDALNNLSTADIDARLTAHYTATLDARFDTLDTSIANVITTGNSAWATATGFSTHTPAQVRTEIDSNSTQLAAILADTDSTVTTLANGGAIETRFDTLDAAVANVITTGNSAWATATGFSTHNAAAVRTEIDANSSQLAAILADTDATITTLSSGGEIHTDIANISPGAPSVYSVDIVSEARTWVGHPEHATARNKVIVSQGDISHYAFDFGLKLNPGTGVSAAGSVVLVSGDADLTFATPVVAKDNRAIHCQIQGQLAGKTYRVECFATTSDGQTISVRGDLVVRS